MNHVLSEILITSNLRNSFTKADATNLLSFRRDIEKSLALSSGKQFDSELDKKLKEWDGGAPTSISLSSVASPIGKRGRGGSIAGSRTAHSVEPNSERKGRPPKRKKPGLPPSFDLAKQSGGDPSVPSSPDGATPVVRSGRGGPLDGLTFRIGKSVDSLELQEKIAAAGGVVLQYTTKHVRYSESRTRFYVGF